MALCDCGKVENKVRFLAGAPPIRGRIKMARTYKIQAARLLYKRRFGDCTRAWSTFSQRQEYLEKRDEAISAAEPKVKQKAQVLKKADRGRAGCRHGCNRKYYATMKVKDRKIRRAVEKEQHHIESILETTKK